MESTFLQLTMNALIDAYHNEPVSLVTGRSANEEEKELAWLKIAKLFNARTRFADCFSITAHVISTDAESAS
jgi:D-aminopeptidase